MIRFCLAAVAIFLIVTGGARAADFDARAAHGKFIEAFNKRDWGTVKSILTSDGVFHRANGEQVFVGPEAIVDRFSSTIGAPDQWNVKFARLDSTAQLTGKDGRVVERGNFAVTAGADDKSCYAGSYMMTWVPQDAGRWGLQLFAWQDVETDLATCR